MKSNSSNTSTMGASSLSRMEKIEVTVIPVDEEPYSKSISVTIQNVGKELS